MDKIQSICKKIKNDEVLCVIFGNKISDGCFNFCLTEENYVNLLRFIKNEEKWDLLSKKNIKIYYYYDLKLVVNDGGDMILERDIASEYYDFLDDNDNGMRMIKHQKDKNMDINIFPGLDKIHDIRKIREIIFKKDDTLIKFMVVNHSNKDITFEVMLETRTLNHKILEKLFVFFKINKITKYFDMKLENTNKLSISIL